MGKPHLPATFYIIETLVYIPLAYVLIHKLGINGAAFAWLTRVVLDTTLLHKASCVCFGVRIGLWYCQLLYRGLPAAVFSYFSFWWLKNLKFHFLSPQNICGILLISVLYGYVLWKWVLDSIARSKTVEFLKNFYRRAL